MSTFLFIVLIAAMIMVVVSLVRGIIAFLRTAKIDIENGGDGNLRELQLKQNKMMWARIVYQGLAIVIIGLLLASR